MFKFITHRPLWVNILTGIALALIIFFIFIFSLKWCTHHNESMAVPSVLGKSFNEAEQILSDAGFEVVLQDSVYTDTTKPMNVLKQIPEADEQVKINRKVYLVVNRSVPPLVEMPNLIGFSRRSAEMILKNANLQVGKISYKPDFATETVLEQIYEGQEVKPGTKLRMGSSVSLVLANGLGEQEFAVPSLVGLTYCEAKARLQGLGLEFGSKIASGEIIDTCNAFIYRQSPQRLDGDDNLRMIRAGQMMDIWYQQDRPVAPDTLSSSLPLSPEEE